MRVGDRLITRQPRVEQAREHPAHERVRVDLGDVGISPVALVHRQLFVEERLAVVQRLRVFLRAPDQLLLVLLRRLDIENERVLGEDIQHLRVVQLAQGTTGIVDEMLVAVDFVRLADEFRHVLHGRHLGLAVQFLPMLEFLQAESVLFRVAQFPQKARYRRQIVHGDVVADEDRVGAQQFVQERYLHRLLLDVIQNRLVKVARADAVVTGVVKPVFLAQPDRQARLAHPGHAEEGDGPV